MRNCSIIFHTASPFRLEIKNPIKELINPALEGTKKCFQISRQDRCCKKNCINK